MKITDSGVVGECFHGSPVLGRRRTPLLVLHDLNTVPLSHPPACLSKHAIKGIKRKTDRYIAPQLETSQGHTYSQNANDKLKRFSS